jgi:hypothetical protein
VNINISLDGTKIQQVLSTKFLGVEIDQFLSWRSHIKKIESKISAMIGILAKIRYKLSEDTACLLYSIIILPHLNYCNIVWGNNYKSALNRLDVLQKRALRICILSNRRVSSNVLFNKCAALNIFDLNKLHVSKFMYLLDTDLLPKSVSKMFVRINTFHLHYTRGSDGFFHTRSASAARKFSVFIAGAKMWDSLPGDVKRLRSPQKFNVHIKKLLLTSYN